jgi:cellulose synthase/poly-beta-1,6-N-acetylglucosamine synthase-like glycosyltransferase
MTQIKKIATIVTAILLLAVVTLILLLIPPESVWVAFALVVATAAYFIILLIVRGEQVREKYPKYWHGVFSFLTYFIIMFIVFTVLFFYAIPSIWTIILMVSLMLTLVIHYITVPLAIIQKFREDKTISTPLEKFPKITIIVPAYNEEKVLARTIENLIEAYYPNKEIIVVDDGSVDSTFEIAKKFESRGVKPIRRINGGKYAALNTGIAYATGEIIITVDADSLITRTALVEIVKGFEDPEVGGIAGTLKVLNRNKFLAKLQAMEYLVQIEIVRRAFNNFGTITVAPGAFSAFRRTVLAQSGNYDPDRLLEDFDLTIKIQKAHKVIRGNSEALCYTEAPETLRDIYKQRLSWYRGDFQNFWKHRDAFTNPKFGYMRSLTFPYMLLSMILVPFASIIVIAASIAMILSGEWMILVYAFAIFVVLQFLLSLLAILLGKDDYKLLLLSPFYIVGYKHFLDFIMIKALFDIIINRGQYLKRERVTRIGFQERSQVTT